MVDLEDMQFGVRIAVGERIEACAQNHKLSDSLRDGLGQFVFGITAAGSHEGAEGARKSMVLFRVGTKVLRGFRADNAQGKRIVEHSGMVMELMGGAANGYALGGAAEVAFLHNAIDYLLARIVWKTSGAKAPHRFETLYAALKGRSFTVAPAFGYLFQIVDLTYMPRSGANRFRALKPRSSVVGWALYLHRRGLGVGQSAFIARAEFAEQAPGINAEIVIVIPGKANGVFADALGGKRPGWGFIHRQHAGLQLLRLAGFAARFFALFVAHGAWAGVAEIDESIVRNVAILPLDVEACACGYVYLYRPGISRGCGRLKRGLHGFSIA